MEVMQEQEDFLNIVTTFQHKNYKNTLNQIEEYINKYNIISIKLLDIYYKSLYKLKMYNDALNVLNTIKSNYSTYFKPFHLLKQYIKLESEENLTPIYEEYKDLLTPAEKRSLSSFSFLCEKHLFARYLLLEYMKETNNEENEIDNKKLNRITHYIENEESHEILYEHFVMKGNELTSGYVINATVNEYQNIYNEDPKKSDRPYLVWRKIGNKIYALKLTSRVKTKIKDSILQKDKYNFLKKDTEVKDNIIEINEEDIRTVNGRITKEDYKNIVKKIYTLYSFKYGYQSKGDIEFIDYYNQNHLNLKENNIIKIYDKETKNFTYYFVLSIEKENKLKCVELSNESSNYQLKNSKIISFNLKKPVLNVFELDDKKTERLRKAISKKINYEQDLIGKTVKTKDNKVLDVLRREGDYYTCIDKTISMTTLITIVLLSINEAVTIIDDINERTFQTELFELKNTITKRNGLRKKIYKCLKK